MVASRLVIAPLVLGLGLGTGCAMALRQGGDEIRRQQSGSEPYATNASSHPRRSKPPWRSIAHDAGRDAADGLIDGALAAAREPERRERLERLGEAVEARIGGSARAAGEGLVAGMATALPRLQPGVVALLDGVRDELGMDPEETGRRLGRGMMAGTREGLETLRPELRRLLADDVLGVFGEAFGPGLRERAHRDVAPAIRALELPALAEDVGRSTARGLSDGIAEALERDGRLGRVLDERVTGAKEAVDVWLVRAILLALVIAVAVALALVFRWLRERAERLEAERARQAAAEEGERRERMLRLVTGAIKQAGARDGLAAFREEMKRLSEQADQRETAAALSYFLTREGLKLERPSA